MPTVTVIHTATATTMITEAAALYRLLAWLSPSYPVGAFSHSNGLEWAVEAGDAATAEAVGDWIEDILRHGGGRQDALLFCATHAAALDGGEGLADIIELAAAFFPSAERRSESLSQGRAFVLATNAAWAPDTLLPAGDIAYPVAVALASARHGIACDMALTAYLHAFVANLVSAAVRLVPLGQTQGQRLLARLEPVVAEIADAATGADLDDLGGCAFLADIASMNHETQYTRLFRT
ncbi:urease accessory protein UreF [Rhodoligotrophos appendicifer]|uniref:urease accessory protein UreF n=1 Tax=Rhodoligotrophos appendicifer TaxID=987056 RepID=UPI001FE58320|nr:urease accessory protein UreF [Rhodoligotrophos appendicifer]